MCLGDWRLGRLVKSQYKEGMGDITGLVDIPSNRQRVGITWLSVQSDANYDVVAIGDLDDNIYQRIPPGFSPVHWTIVTHGDLPTRHLQLNVGAGTNVSWIEYYMPERVLAKADAWLKEQGFF